MQLRACLHLASFQKALVPLPIILQKSPCKAGGLVSRVLHTIEDPEVHPVLGSPDDGEQPVQVEVLPSRWMDKVHVPYGKALLPWLPEMPLGLPDKVLREVLVQVLGGSVRIILVGLEPLCEVCLLGRGALQDLEGVLTWLEEDLLLILDMDREAID